MGYINFYTIVTVLFIIIIIGLVIWIRTSFNSQQVTDTKNTAIQQDNMISNCPDYWIDSLGNGKQCISTGSNITSTCVGKMDFSGNSCNKLKKILPCTGMIWDGITYGNNSTISLKSCDIEPPAPTS
jgi:hypothetical protein